MIAIEPPSGGKVAVALISGALELYRGPVVHFRLDPSHPDFAATGLKKECYIAGDEIQNLNTDRLTRRRGQLQGSLLESFEDWI
ncbi:MAG: hypothetical protein ABSE73_27460 [Planctomycetota bacterium]